MSDKPDTMTIDEQVEYLMQGTEYGDDALREAMAQELRARLIEAQGENRPLRVYAGFDPRTSDLHLGHTVPMRKLRQFQELGHEVTFLVGNYTSLIGDPSDKDRLRPQLTPDEVEHNARTYAEQAYKIMDRDKTLIRYNATWLSKLNFAELIQLASNFTLQQFVSRENFRLRWEKGDPIYLHETFYAIMQGYDAYAMHSDVQVGGTDQLFNIITAARKLMTSLGDKPNIGVILGILPGTDGEIKMSKSLGNHIPLLSDPEDMYGKVMSVPDKAMGQYFRLVTRWTPPQIHKIESGLSEGRLHPRDVKMQLAREIVSIYYSPAQASQAEAEFVRVFQQGDLPDEMPQFQLKDGLTVLEVLVDSGLVSSKSEGRRLLSQNAVRLDGALLKEPHQVFPGPGVLQVGRRRYLRVL
ncbi:MAG: tyrosine--tRNA ligase [Anaerolineae bacterium UTCFX2]|jgi:tyrosyl-tRNA synthetase|nr:tyrosine--tRNA ligase [Anaerolineales bacterium]OQY88892.1 MAG: tyrosine--tRNA ligase [Anaerolineae bacterium UTCFX2]